MTMPSHETAEQVIEIAPRELIARIPDSTEQREALRLVDVLGDLVHDAIEKVPPVRASLE